MVKTRIVQFAREGGPEVLELVSMVAPAPKRGEVRIRVEAIGLNRAEAMYRGGYYFERAQHFPARLGYEASGVVESVGPEVEGLSVGQAVNTIAAFSMQEHGIYGELVTVPARAVIPRPDGVTAVTAAAIWTAAATAYGGLIEVGHLRAGDTVVLTAAAGAVGIAAIQTANRIGAQAIAVTRDPHKTETLLEAGASRVLIAGRDDLLGAVKAATGGRGADLVFDAISGAGVGELARATARGGMLLLYGFYSMPARPGGFGTTGTPLPMEFGIDMRWYAMTDTFFDPSSRARMEQFVVSGLRAGTLAPRIDRTFELDQIVEAHRHLESNAHVGKIVVTVR